MRAHRPLLAVAAATLALGATACGDDAGSEATNASPAATSGATASAPPVTAPPRPRPAPAPLAGLPAFTAGFESWDRLNSEPIPPDSAQTRRVGVDAHRGTKNVHVSVPRERLRAGDGQRFPYPEGTIVVKAAGEDPSTPTLVAVMRKVAGSDPGHGDWEFQEYKRSGTGEAFSTSAGLTGATCWGCHAIAMDTDWVFTTLDR
jgi:hypothetical protein